MTLKNNDYILENKLGIKDIFILNEHERKIVTFNEIIIRRKNYKKFNFNTLKSMHKELFKEIYQWAGMVRKVNISKGKCFFLSNRKYLFFCRYYFSEIRKRKLFKRSISR